MPEGFRSRALAVAVFGAASLVVWASLTASQALARSFSLGIYAVANLLVFLDMFDFVLRFYLRRAQTATGQPGSRSRTSVRLEVGRYTLYEKRLHLRPYALVISMHNAEDELDDFMETMEPYRDRIWIIDDGSTDQTVVRLRQAGWRCLEAGVNRRKPHAIRALLVTLPAEIETVLVLDPDVSLLDSERNGLPDLEEVIFDFQRSKFAAVCPRISIRKKEGLLARFERFEYIIAFSLGRNSLADHCINSGVSIYRRSALEEVLRRHSLSVYAEDLENSVLLLGAGERVYYDARLVLETPPQQGWSRWFSQRTGWAFGLIKVYTERFEDVRRVARRGAGAAYQFLFYMGVFNLLLLPLKLVGLILLCLSLARGVDSLLSLGWMPAWRIADPVYFAAAAAKYFMLSVAMIITAAPRGERRYFLPLAPLYFLYGLLQILPTAVGYSNWFSLRFWGRRVIEDHYQDENSLVFEYRNNGVQSAVGER